MLLMDDEFRTNLLDAADVTEFLAHIDEAERKKFLKSTEKEKQEQDQDQPEEGYRVLAVTACPTGIAHTYMAAESLENKANDVPDSGRIYRHGACGQTGIDARNRRRSSGEKRYDNGCRGDRLGVFRFLWRTDRRFCGRTDHARFKENSGKASKSAGGNKADAFVSVFGNRGNGSLMVFVVNPPVGAFNEWLNQVLASMGESSRVLLGAVLGGMVPPIGIALATLFLKNGLQRVNSRQWQRISLWAFLYHRGGNPVCSFRSAAVSGCRCGRFCRGNAWESFC